MRRSSLAPLLAALAFALAAAGLAGCGQDATAPPDGAAAEARTMRLGARVFAEHCQTCHPLLGRPNTDVHEDFPPGLDLDQVQPTRALAARVVASGGVAMGGFGGVLSRREQEAVVAYVLAVGGRDADVPAGTSRAALARGERVYDEHCARCHVLDGRGGGRPNPIWVATNFDELRPGVLHTERIVREGQVEANPYYLGSEYAAMPSFRARLTVHEMRAVALYVNAAARGGPPGTP